MLREMEQNVDRRAAALKLVEAKKEVFEKVVAQKAHQLLQTIPRNKQLMPSGQFNNTQVNTVSTSISNVILQSCHHLSFIIIEIPSSCCFGG